jgi:hypothetical protein
LGLLVFTFFFFKGVRIQPQDGSWNLDGLRLFETPTGTQAWVVVYPKKYAFLLVLPFYVMLCYVIPLTFFPPFSRYNDVSDFVPNFVSLSQVSGYDITRDPEYTEVPDSKSPPSSLSLSPSLLAFIANL